MKVKPIAIAVVVVVAAGAATGVVLGGKSDTKTKTVTVAGPSQTVTKAPSLVPQPEPTDTETTPATTSTTAGTGTAGFDPVALDETLVTIDDTTVSTREDSTVALRDVAYGALAQLQQGPEHPDSMTFTFAMAYRNGAADFYDFELTVPEGASRLTAQMGFLKGDASGNRVKVAFFENQYEEGDKPLAQRALDSASEVGPVDLAVGSASKIIVRFVCLNRDHVWRAPSGDAPRFGFVDARFS